MLRPLESPPQIEGSVTSCRSACLRAVRHLLRVQRDDEAQDLHLPVGTDDAEAQLGVRPLEVGDERDIRPVMRRHFAEHRLATQQRQVSTAVG
ncbi:hypothetical protein [Reticulibacter mediterranei]|uniref:hypothetical protein n=1 Tax=Reticulibacter mediterranei TaxID=2778369 RepID=UPI001C68BD62|nr:hypothetical protein [Reticulibacter mediterranei]